MCNFHVNFLDDKDFYRKGFHECDGDQILFDECNDPIDPDWSEKHIILTRTGLLWKYEPRGKYKRWHICAKHRKWYGKEFIRQLKQAKCIYKEHKSGKSLKGHTVTMSHSRAFVDQGLILPYQAKICVTCSIEIPSVVAKWKEEADNRESSESEDEEEEMDVEGNQLLNLSMSTKTESSYAPSSIQSSLTFDSQGTSDGPTQPASQPSDDATDLVLKLIQYVEPSFTRKQIAKKTTRSFKGLGKTSKKKLRRTIGLANKAIITAMTHHDEDHEPIWRDVKESECIERALGLIRFLDKNLKLIIRAYNKAPSENERLQIVTAVADIKFCKLNQFNPPKTPKLKIETGDENPIEGSSSGNQQKKRVADFELEFEDVPMEVLELGDEQSEVGKVVETTDEIELVPQRKSPKRARMLPDADKSPKTSNLNRTQISFNEKYAHEHGSGPARASTSGIGNTNVYASVGPVISGDEVENHGDSKMDVPASEDMEMNSADESMTENITEKENIIDNENITEKENDFNEVHHVVASTNIKNFWNPPLTAKFHRKAIAQRKISKAALQKVKKKIRRRQTVEKGTIAFVVEILTSEEHQQGVAHGTKLVKFPDGTTERIARVIRKQHQAYLVRLIQAHLKENSMQKLQFSTLKRLLKLLPAADAREIKGLDPKYELHRRAFIDLQEICTELHNVFTLKDDEKNSDLVEKVQQGLTTSASYLLGHFVYNLSENSKCASHDINFACSDSKNSNQQNMGSREHLDITERYTEECDYCNVLPAAGALLEELLEEAKDNFTELEFQRKSKETKDSQEYIASYKKQVYRHWVGSKRWDQYYKDKNPKRAMAKMDFAMKAVLEKARETQSEWFGKLEVLLM